MYDFEEVWCVGFAFLRDSGELPQPLCLVAHELLSGRHTEVNTAELMVLDSPPYSTGDQCLLVAFGAIDALHCCRRLGWPMPRHLLDLHAEFRVVTNGVLHPDTAWLHGACVHYSLRYMAAGLKEQIEPAERDGFGYSQSVSTMLEHCSGDVAALADLYQAMVPTIHWSQALLRGRYMKALAQVEAKGLPIDLEALARFRRGWTRLRYQLILDLDAMTGCYCDNRFNSQRFLAFLDKQRIAWPRTAFGLPILNDDTFKEMASRHPALAKLHELRRTLSAMRSMDLGTGADGRSRPALKPWRSRTGRNQPSTSRFAFGLPSWMRGFIKPKTGYALSCIDWSQQEFGIAAALSQDENMQVAYLSGDPYLAFAKQVGTVPPDATAQTHPQDRDRFKACILAVQYGMGEDSLARRIGQTPAHAAALLRQHRDAYKTFWQWSDRVVSHALAERELTATFGWRIQVKGEVNERSLRNFLMQANGSEMMRIACILAVERGVQVCAPVHDAFVIEAPIEEIESAEQIMQNCMAEASAIVLDKFELRSATKRIVAPERYHDPRGLPMWQRVDTLLCQLDAVELA